MKLCRIGELGKEKPAIIDKDGSYKDLSSTISDLNPENLNFETLDKIKKLNTKDLPTLKANSRIGACVNNPSKFLGIGLNFKDHARKLAFAPHLNIGVFSLMKNSPCWETWQKNLNKVLLKGRIFGSEGLAINMAVYLDNVPTEFLPINHNWITSHLLPIYDEKNNTFREPNIPNNEIGIIHLAAGMWKNGVDMRVDKNIKVNIKTLEGKILEKSLRNLIK